MNTQTIFGQAVAIRKSIRAAMPSQKPTQFAVHLPQPKRYPTSLSSKSAASPPKATFELGTLHNEAVIFIRFSYDAQLVGRVRQLTGVRWSRSQKAWYVRDNDHYRQLFKLIPRECGKEALMKVSDANRPALQRFIDTLRLKGYSHNTENTYRNEFAQLLLLLGDVHVDTMTPELLRSYMLYCTTELKLSEAHLHSRLNAIKFYFEQVLQQEKFFAEIPRPKKHSTLPKHISTRDVKKLFECTENIKHNTMLKLCYGMGLRVSEIVALKVKHIDSGNMQVLIEKAKGKKDRYANLPESLLEQLRQYFKEYRPKEYLFEGQYGGQYSTRSAQAVFEQAMKRASINKKVGIHGLRHSYATHLMEAGTDIGHIQKLLGHANITTTLIYAQVTNRDTKKVKSPLDSL
ncbi:MAG: tyrosine-type recombinase/integrase [Flavobacteriales bacterium]|nr:tyrosine-type recombinase/integrase [Flavobacteriales bacterium]